MVLFSDFQVFSVFSRGTNQVCKEYLIIKNINKTYICDHINQSGST